MMVIINGIELSPAQITTLRVAISSFIVDLKNEGLGDDDHGKKITALYIERAQEIEHILI